MKKVCICLVSLFCLLTLVSCAPAKQGNDTTTTKNAALSEGPETKSASAKVFAQVIHANETVFEGKLPENTDQDVPKLSASVNGNTWRIAGKPYTSCPTINFVDGAAYWKVDLTRLQLIGVHKGTLFYAAEATHPQVVVARMSNSLFLLVSDTSLLDPRQYTFKDLSPEVLSKDSALPAAELENLWSAHLSSHAAPGLILADGDTGLSRIWFRLKDHGELRYYLPYERLSNKYVTGGVFDASDLDF